MSLTAEDIQTKQFHVRFRGFDVEEVDAFLERIAENFALLQDEKRLLKEQVDKLEMTIKEFHSQERTFQHAIISAQKIADEMLEKTRKDSQEKMAAAQEKIDRLRSVGKKELETMLHQIKELKESKEKIKKELRTYLQEYLSRLDRDMIPDENTPLSLLQSDITEDKGDVSRFDEEGEEKGAKGDDLDDLYEKMDLPDDFKQEDEEDGTKKAMARALIDDESFEPEVEDDKKNLTIPDLDGDMLFSLDDPLDDDNEPRVAMDNHFDEDLLENVKVK
ncbi:MAG: DivIVA domain-containing protein [Pseudomonadota bacterium]